MCAEWRLLRHAVVLLGLFLQEFHVLGGSIVSVSLSSLPVKRNGTW
jgi:uncharacterized membrane protein YadS